MNDPHNNINRYCDVIGVKAEPRSWRLVEFVRDAGGKASYRLVNDTTGARMRAGLDNLTNLY